MSIHVRVTELPASVQAALKGVDYGARDIEIIPTEEMDMSSSATWKGARGFVCMVNLVTGDRRTLTGDWGGQNPFDAKPVDTDQTVYPLPPTGMVIRGQTGYPRTLARIYVHPSLMSGNLLPASDAEGPTQAQLNALYCFGHIKGGQYRRDEMRRRHVTQSDVDECVARGWIKVNRAGAGQITTEGKNALGSFRY
jgi:hypothetical protein